MDFENRDSVPDCSEPCCAAGPDPAGHMYAALRFGPAKRFMGVEELLLIERRMKLAERLAEDAERLRKRLEKDSPDI